MNERIRELAEQSKKKPFGDSWCYADPQEFEQQFAELIVNECYEKLISMDQQVKGSHNYYKHAAIQIKLHFGVKP
jgi:hypothetical protein